MSRPPELVLRLGYEGLPCLYLQADSYEDELRLRSWLRRSPVFEALLGLLDVPDDGGDPRGAA